jgi:beta-lactamase regulating signal transducer with metallopeptidase domain
MFRFQCFLGARTDLVRTNTPASLPINAPSMHAPAFALSTLVLAVWLCGVAPFLMPVAIGVWQVDRIRRSALPWGRAQSAASALASECGNGRRVDLGIHEALPGPMTCGILRPAIVFPRDA